LEQQLSPSVLAEIVDCAVRNVKGRKVFAENLRIELSNYSYQQLQEDSNEFSAIKAMYEGYTRNGDAEKFYGKYYATVAAKSTQFFSEFLGMQQHYWQPKLLTVCWHTLSNKNTLPKAVII